MARIHMIACVAAAMLALCATQVAAGGNPNFYIPPVTGLNNTVAMVYVEKYHAIMQQIMATAKGDVTKCPQAEKLLYETAQMLQEPASHWACGCEIAFTLYQKQDHTFNTVTPGVDDVMVPYVFMTCVTDAQCPGEESSCMTHNVPHVCKPWVYCQALGDCPEHDN